jgi:hypothetical protein
MSLDQRPAYFESDNDFDALYPLYIQELSGVHWTPLAVARTAAQFLADVPGAKVLDIGAGVGKFCIAAGLCTNGMFTGIEQRKNFVKAGNKLIKRMALTNVSLIHGNFTELDLYGYRGIYFFNSFHENLVIADSLDEKIERSPELYAYYTAYLFAHLALMPQGTRLATYWLTTNEVPGNYRLQNSCFDEKLKLWVKTH